jgi:hypothetical protein
VRKAVPLLLFLVIGCGSFDADDTKEAAAVVKAEQLQTCAKSYLAKHDEKLGSLDPLAEYAADGEQALLDPWGQPFQFRYVIDPETQLERLVIWTVAPKSGRVLAAPPHLAKQVSAAN